MSLLGIDVGTSGCKAGLFAEDGRCLTAAYREYSALHPREGWTELDSRHVAQRVKDVIREVVASSSGDPVKALCVSSMGEAMTPVTRDRKILGNCIPSSDTRGAEYIDALKRRMTQEEFYQINPNILGTNYSLPKLKWIKEHQPELYEEADCFMLWGDLVGFLLGAEPATSFSLANRTLLFDIRSEDWSDRLLALGGIDRAKLPTPRRSGTIAGAVDRRAAAELGLPEGAAIVVGAHDQCCNSLGAGVCSAGRAVCGIGTFECIAPTYNFIPEAAQMIGAGLNVEHHALPGLYVSFIYNQAGILLKWFRDTFASADRRLIGANQDIYDLLTSEMPDGPSRLLTLPYFEMTGPPEFVANASGAIVGLKTNTTRGEILQSIVECETFYFVESLQTLKRMNVDTSEFVATGGGAKSERWLQIKADIFGVPFVRPAITEGSVLGAAILAGMAAGVYESAEEGVARFVTTDRVFEPDPRRHERYMERYDKYRRLFPLLREFLAELERS